MSKRFLLLIAIAALMLAPSIAGAVPIAIGGTGVLGTFSGSFDYTPTSGTAGTVDIVLNNDSLTVGYITGFVFNIPTGADVSAANLTGTNTEFDLLGAAASFNDGVNAAPHGRFDIGAALGGNYEGGGDPTLGIITGGSATFHFALTGTGLGALTPQAFLSTLSVGPGDGEGVQGLVVRFRGFPGEDGGSDKVPNGPPPPIPEPGTLSLLGLGIASLAARRRARAGKK